MTDIAQQRPFSPKLLTVQECLGRLPIRMSEREFRRKIRKSGHYYEHRRQIMLSEADFAAIMEGLRPCSNSRRAGRRASSNSDA